MDVLLMNKSTVAQQVETSNLSSSAQRVLQRKCACSNQTVGGGECAECGKKTSSIQRKLTIGASNDSLERETDRVADQVTAASAHSTASEAPLHIQCYTGQAAVSADTAPASVDRVLANSGRPLETTLRHDMERCFGQYFSQIRVHSGMVAEQSTCDVNAQTCVRLIDAALGYFFCLSEDIQSANTNKHDVLLEHRSEEVRASHNTRLGTAPTSCQHQDYI